jgi:hypothetical protein
MRVFFVFMVEHDGCLFGQLSYPIARAKFLPFLIPSKKRQGACTESPPYRVVIRVDGEVEKASRRKTVGSHPCDEAYSGYPVQWTIF